MYLNILKKDLKSKKTMNMILLVFIILATMFVSSSVNNILRVTTALDDYFKMANAPDYLVTTMNKNLAVGIDETISSAKAVDSYAVEDVLFLAPDNFIFGDKDITAKGGTNIVQSDIGMNYFLSDGSILEKVNQGELYITENKAAAIGVEIGDKLTIELNGINCELIFKGKIKDALFGSNQVTITRYIISVEDYNALTSAENAEEFYGGSLVYIHSSDIDTLVKQIKPLADNSFLTFDRASMEFCYIFDMINPTGSIAQTLREMYVSPSVSRAIIRTMEIVKELRKITKKDPDKIFVEMARGGKPEEKGKRTSSRREQIEKLYDSAKAFVSDEDISHLRSQLGSLSDEQLRSEKYYLYFIQFGKCMYSGETIDFSRLGDNHCYDIDHIFPQSKINDDSLHNKVLVKSQLNGEKSDDYPIKAEIRNKMHPLWKNLFYRDPKNPTDKVKYERLTRSTPFTEDELAGFIERQLVETRQSTKAVATLLKEMFPDSKIVYVKAGQVSEFRHDFDMLKCREINDLHHAKDAYLNIVIGNVHDVKFTSNPMNFVKNADKHYTIKVKETLKHKVSRNGETAWNPETDFDTVKRMMSKNSVRYVRYCYKRKGGFFNQNPDRAGNPDLARLKKDLDPVKYGGYNSKSISCFSLIKCTGVGAVIIPVELLCEKRYFSDDSFASEYAYSVLKNALPAKNIAKISIDDISFPLKRRPIKINTLFEFDGYRVNIRSKDSYHYFTISSAMAAIYSKDTSDYIKAVSSYIDKSDKGSKFKPGEAFDVLSNLKVYDEIAKKCISEPFSKINKLAEAGKKMEEGRDKFAELSIIEQMKTLLLLVDILKTGRINTCNLKPVGGVESYHTERMSAILKNTKYSDIRIIDQSPTGLYEKKSDNLLEL